MADMFGSGNRKDKWIKKATEWINYLLNHKSDKLVAGSNVKLTPDPVNHTITIDAEGGGGGGGTITDVEVNGQSVVSGTVAEIDLTGYAETADLAEVAMSGEYEDLNNRPSIPTKTSELANDSGFITTETDPTVPSWAKANTKPAYTASEVGAIALAARGAVNGVASLGADGKVPSSELPSYVDDVLEYTSKSAFPSTGESGKIYVALDTNCTYRWSGSAYVEISEGLALGETQGTAYEGSKGKLNADAIAALQNGKVDKETGKGLSSNDYTTAEKTKLAGIEAGAQVNTVTSVAGKTGAVTLTKSDVGLGNVPNVTTDNQTPTVTEAESRSNLKTGDTLKTIIGKIKKFFSDLKTVAFTGSYNDLTDQPTIPADTTYTFENGTNGFRVTPSGGTAQTVKVTPSISNNVTGSGTSGKLAKFNGTNTIADGPALGSDTTKFLRNDGSWAVPSGTYAMPLAADGTRGGAQIGYTQSGKNYPVQLSGEKMYVNVPWTDTKVTAVSKHYTPTEDSTAQLDADASSSTAATWDTTSLVTGVTVKRDAKGHVTGLGVDSIKMPANPNTDTKVRQSLSTTNKNYPVLLSYAESSDSTANVDNVSYRANAIYANPSTGTLTAPSYGVQSITVKTGDTAQSKITLQTLMTWLITTKKYIPSGVACHVVLQVSWSYANNDILQLTAANPNGTSTNYELQLAGAIIEFIGGATAYNAGVFRLRIHSSPTTSFTPTSGYTTFPVDHIAEYTCNGSQYTPAWKLILEGGDLGSYLLKSGGTMTGRLTTTKPINQVITGGSGTVGSTSNNVYKPSTWKFNQSMATPTHGDIITIEPPVNGHANGVWLSMDNGTTYYPCSVNNGTSRLQSQFPSGSLCMLQFDSNASTTTYPVAGAASTSSVTGGAWRVLNFYDTTYNFSGTTFRSYNGTSSHEHNANNMYYNGHWQYTSNGPGTDLGASGTTGGMYSQAQDTNNVGQIAQDYKNGNLFVRGKNNGTWTDWKAIQTKWTLAGTATSMVHGTGTSLICTIPSTCEEVRIEAVVTGFRQKMFLSKSVLVTTLLGCLPQVNDAFVITMTMDSIESTYDETEPEIGNSRVSVAVGIKRVSSGFEFRKVFGTRSEAYGYFEDLEMHEFAGNDDPIIYFYYR